MTDVDSTGFRSTHLIAASRDRVWEVLTSPSAFATWFGTDAVDVPLDQLTWRAVAGAPWSAQMVLPGGATIDWDGEMLAVDAPNGCSLTLSQSGGGLDADGYAQAAAGWAGFVDVIERLSQE
ncbi:SRPBCC domain-containing protein [Microcella sp.]|uniref:SRPBCC family protein n=1 Tax=Microcella sp. TaxID=1913979 RepID=UPI00391BEE5F